MGEKLVVARVQDGRALVTELLYFLIVVVVKPQKP